MMTFPTLKFIGESHFGLVPAFRLIKEQNYREITIRVTDLFWQRLTFRADVPKLILSSVIDRGGAKVLTINQAATEVWMGRTLILLITYFVLKKIRIL